jgi:hypothetical protein
MNYSALTLSPHELPTMTLNPLNYHLMILSPISLVKGVKTNGQRSCDLHVPF